jgi:hypothetical protein
MTRCAPEQKLVGQIACHAMKQDRRNSKYRRPPQPPPEFFGEFAIGDRDWRPGIDRA